MSWEKHLSYKRKWKTKIPIIGATDSWDRTVRKKSNPKEEKYEELEIRFSSKSFPRKLSNCLDFQGDFIIWP